VHDYYKAKLAVMNIGDVFTTGPEEAAWVMNTMVQPTSVIVSHANEPATKDGKVLPNTRTAAFIKNTQAPVYVPLSGKTLEFDSDGKCTQGAADRALNNRLRNYLVIAPSLAAKRPTDTCMSSPASPQQEDFPTGPFAFNRCARSWQVIARSPSRAAITLVLKVG